MNLLSGSIQRIQCNPSFLNRVDRVEVFKSDDNLFNKVVEAAPNAMIVVDGHGRIQLLNLQVEKLFGYERKELIGAPIEKLIPQRYRHSHEHVRANFLKDPQSRAMGAGRELFGVRKDGVEVPVEIGLNPLEIKGEMFVLASVIDISQRKGAEDRFRLAVEAAPNSMIMVDQSGRIVMANNQTEKLFGYDRSQLLGQPIEILVPERFREKHPGHRNVFFHSPQVRAMGAGRDLFGRRIDGVEVPVEIGLTPVETGDGMFVLASIIDITERKKNEQLLASREAALESSRVKSQFLATISHEIRTPINGIIGLTSLLFDSPMNAEQLENLRGIRSSADALLSLINDVLDFSQIEADKMEFEVDNFSLDQIISDTVSIVSSSVKKKGLRLEVLVDPQLPHWWKGDSSKIRQILTNLVGNAIKFTESGGVTIRVRFPFNDQKPSTLLLEVEDTGIGIPPDIQARLFEVFTQGDNSTRRKFGGTGLGLSISKRLVLKMGGQIGVRSTPGNGSCFWFHLPLEKGEEVLHVVKKVALDRKVRPKRADFKVLVVEDNRINQRVALGALKKLGLAGQAVGNGFEAVEILKKIPFDLVLMDCHMPEMDGYEATVQLRSSDLDRLRSVPIIAMTANVMPGDRERCLQIGMNDYLAKPIDPQDFERIMGKWVEFEVIEESEAAVIQTPLATDQVAEIRTAFEKAKKGYGVPTAIEVFKTFLDFAIESVTNIEKYFKSDEKGMLESESHSLKSASLLVGCRELSEKSAAIELSCRTKNDQNIEKEIAELGMALEKVRPVLQGMRSEFVDKKP